MAERGLTVSNESVRRWVLSWLTFQKIGNDAMVMGDLVLTAEEVSAVMKKLVEGGIDITALHNHLLRSSPTTLYMHIRGHVDPV